jgi:hypothetical protein
MTRALSIVIDAQTSRAKHGGAWMADIIAASDDGTTLLSRVGGMPPAPIEQDTGPPGRIDYSLCRVNVATGDLQVIAPLRSVFF